MNVSVTLNSDSCQLINIINWYYKRIKICLNPSEKGELQQSRNYPSRVLEHNRRHQLTVRICDIVFLDFEFGRDSASTLEIILSSPEEESFRERQPFHSSNITIIYTPPIPGNVLPRH